MKKSIKIFFIDFWDGFESHNFILKILERTYDIVLDSETPDYIFYSVFGERHKSYDDCIKVFFSGENICPNFNHCDYALAFNYLTYSDRYLRYPLHVCAAYLQRVRSIDLTKAAGRKFCNFVYSNSESDTCRTDFFHKLSEYKRVDSGGRCENNIGGTVADKLSFIADYKFTIAFENSAMPGYTTEKLLEPLMVKSVPIYWGDPLVGLDFNPRAFINANDFATLDELVEEVKRVDNDDQAYLEMLAQPIWIQGDEYVNMMNDKLLDFLSNIIEQPKQSARRRPICRVATIKANTQQQSKKTKLSRMIKKFFARDRK